MRTARRAFLLATALTVVSPLASAYYYYIFFAAALVLIHHSRLIST